MDRLLDSPRFGERWGRHWLDLVRYAESRGHEFDYTIPNAYQYRDYVIRAFNSDVPYNQFVMEHLAGDLLTRPLTGSARRRIARRRTVPTNRSSAPVLVSRRGMPFARRYSSGPGRPLRQSHRRDDQDVPRADGVLRPLPRSQVRRHLDAGLLRPLRRFSRAATIAWPASTVSRTIGRRPRSCGRFARKAARCSARRLPGRHGQRLTSWMRISSPPPASRIAPRSLIRLW